MRRRVLALTLGALVALGASPSPTEPVSPGASGPGTEREAALQAVAVASGASLASAAAFADSLETGIRLVRVRIVDELEMGVMLLSETGVTLAEPPELCFHWFHAAPDDAGLESPCWGVPDPSAVFAEQMARADGTWRLDPGGVVSNQVFMTRGGGRCDFPPGDWVLRVRYVPLVDGVAQEPRYVRAPFEVAYDPREVPRRLSLTETRFCGLASGIVRDQGEAPSAAP